MLEIVKAYQESILKMNSASFVIAHRSVPFRPRRNLRRIRGREVGVDAQLQARALEEVRIVVLVVLGEPLDQFVGFYDLFQASLQIILRKWVAWICIFA